MKIRPMVLIALVIAVADESPGQSPIPSPSAVPRLHRPAGQAPGGWAPEIETFLRQLCETYAKGETYQDQGRVRMIDQQGRVKTTTEMPMELAFKRPNRLMLDGGQVLISCDGRSLLMIVSRLRQYTQQPAPEKIERKHLQASSLMGGVEQGHPELIDFCIRPDAYELWQKQIMKIRWKPDTVVSKIVCRVLEYEAAQGTIVRIFVDPNRRLLLKVEAESALEDRTIHVVYDLGHATVNGPIDESRFASTLPPGFRRVSQFGSVSEPHDDGVSGNPTATNASQIAPVVGKKAAEIRGKDISGRPLTSEELRGKVTLLFFWSLAGGQYSLIAMPVVQQVADYFQSKPDFVVLGISGDVEKPELVRGLMERKKCTFRTVLDEGQRLREAYEIGGEPTFVVIGADGTITWAQLGAPPTLREDLIRVIERTLTKR